MKARKIILAIFTICFSLLFITTISEILLRVLPILGVQFNVLKYDNLVGWGLYPNSTQTYRSDRGAYVKRKVNRWGYLDKDHQKNKPEGAYRIGFFGDSFVEAMQVPLQQTYFRIIENRLKNYEVECLAFGHNGFSSFQSYLNSGRWSGFFDIDLIVYVFVENDLGDQIREINQAAGIPYPVLTDRGLQSDDSFRAKFSYKKTLAFRIYDYLSAHSLLLSTIIERGKLLMRYGIKIKATSQDKMMATTVKNKLKIRSTDLPSSWPEALRIYAQDLGRAVILKWRNETVARQRKFAILYVPREGEFEKKTEDQDSWKAWLESL